MDLNNRPIVLAAIIWVCGYCLAANAEWTWLNWKVGGLGIVLWALLRAIKPSRYSVLSTLLVLLISASYYTGYDQRNVTALEEEIQGGEELVLSGVITSTVVVDGDKVSFTLRTNEYNQERLQVSIRLLTLEEQTIANDWGRGDQVELTGTLKNPDPARNFGGFDYKRYLYLKHIHGILTVKGLSFVEVSPIHTNNTYTLNLLRWNDETRELLGDKFDQLFDSVQAGYMKSLVLGIREDLDPERFGQFSKLGLTHILAISGLHVAVFVAGCMAILKLVGFTREKMQVITLMVVPVYMAIAGGSPSVVRAGLMAMIALYAARRGLLKDGLHLLSAVAITMLLWEPYYLYDVSFQLSFIVTAGLLIGVPRFSEILPIRSRILNSALSVTTVAQLISFPISIYYFNTFSLLSWFANLLLVPFISFLTLPIGSVALMLSLVWLQGGVWVAWLADVCNRITFWVVEGGAAVSLTQQIWPSPSLWWIAAFYLQLMLLYKAFAYWREKGRYEWALAATCVLLLLLTYGYTPLTKGQVGEVSFIDVGQGDSILIHSPEGRVMLIDGGGTISFRKPGEEWKERRDPYEIGAKLLVPLLKKRGIHIIDYLVISHQDADHIGGLQAVQEQIPVKVILFNDSWKGNESSQKLLETAILKGTKLMGGTAGAKVQLDRHTELTVLGPTKNNYNLEIVDDQNGESIILGMSMYDSSFLFTGDIGVQQERDLIKSLSQERNHSYSSTTAFKAEFIDVLKIAHHGSKNSTAAEWLQFWAPRQVVISVGATNSYGHPNAQVLERIESVQASILRTDQDGEVRFRVSKQGLQVSKKLINGGMEYLE